MVLRRLIGPRSYELTKDHLNLVKNRLYELVLLNGPESYISMEMKS